MRKGCCPKCDRKLERATFRNGKLVSVKCGSCGFEYKGGACGTFQAGGIKLKKGG